MKSKSDVIESSGSGEPSKHTKNGNDNNSNENEGLIVTNTAETAANVPKDSKTSANNFALVKTVHDSTSADTVSNSNHTLQH